MIVIDEKAENEFDKKKHKRKGKRSKFSKTFCLTPLKRI